MVCFGKFFLVHMVKLKKETFSLFYLVKKKSQRKKISHFYHYSTSRYSTYIPITKHGIHSINLVYFKHSVKLNSGKRKSPPLYRGCARTARVICPFSLLGSTFFHGPIKVGVRPYCKGGVFSFPGFNFKCLHCTTDPTQTANPDLLF